MRSARGSGFLARRAPGAFRKASRYLPPFAIDLVRHFLAEWEYVPQGWSPRKSNGAGWNDHGVRDAQEKHWPVLRGNLAGPGPLGVSHFPWVQTREDATSHNAMMTYGYVLARAARKKDNLSVLDWGGGCGHYYLYSQALLPDAGIEYHCHDLPLLCRLGESLLPEAHFHEDPEAALGRRYDLVVSSSSLHYFQHWREMTRKLAAAAGEYLYVARLQTVSREPSFVVVQRPGAYRTEYLSWFLNRAEFVSCVEDAGLKLVREFIFMEAWQVRGAPEKGACRGFLFQRQPAIPAEAANHEKG